MAGCSRTTNYRKVVNLYKIMLNEIQDEVQVQIVSHDDSCKNFTEDVYSNSMTCDSETNILSNDQAIECQDPFNMPISNSVLDFDVSQMCTNYFLDDDIEITSSEDETSIDLDLREALRKWCLNFNITREAANDLLKLLSVKLPLEGLPIDSRTLLKTQTNYKIMQLGGGQYYHFGIKNCILKLDNLLNCEKVLLFIGIDGLPLCKSSSKTFWPILGKLNTGTFTFTFVIGIFYGESKPNSNQEYLRPFVQEMCDLEKQGILLSGKRVPIQLDGVIADAPARSFIKGCVSFNSYFGCERCVVKGNWKGRVIFKDINCRKRTDETFKLQLDKNHHVSESPLIELQIGLVSQVPIDYMHLVCLGVIRKLLRVWIKSAQRDGGMSRNDIRRVNERLIQIKSFVPKEFRRKPRSLLDIDRWKATELRSFLLYYGIVVLQGILSTDKYEHLLMLSLATYILLSDKAREVEWNNIARNLYINFVNLVPVLYSEELLVYNIHNLIHLPDDALKYGSLDNVSAFTFENYMQTLKRMLRGKHNYLAQAIRRISESGVQAIPISSKQIHTEISPKDGDSTFLTNDGCLIKVVQTEVVNNRKIYVCQKFRQPCSFFKIPMDSSMLSISTVSNNLCSETFRLDTRKIVRKCLQLPLNGTNSFVVIPMVSNDVYKKCRTQQTPII